ncbi:MAG: NAD-dependent epimerase/dehydratase family protein [Chloroflexota bacterium]|nr:NAD-dependent epimerase/dehydratase family protein [Chloroflexota bacterium]
MQTKRTIFITGASGNMGFEGFKQLLQKRNSCKIVALILPTKKNKEKMSVFEKEPDVRLVWGDLTNYKDVLEGVTGADFVLHVGGMVSPLADYHPELTTKVNIGGIKNIIQAIKAQPNPNQIRLVYIGSIAQTGDRNPPLHWGRVGDPIKISRYDNYAYTKTVAEREVIESGLKYWVSLRQTGILHPNLTKTRDPIMFHVPFQGVLEWVTVQDSGRLLVNVCEENVPEEFWRRIYNIGGGENFRVANYEFMQKSFAVQGIEDFRKLVEPNWFALKNFHGQWYEDSDLLQNYLHFRQETLDEFFTELKEHSPFYTKFAGLVSPKLIKKFTLEPLANHERAPLFGIKHNVKDKISAYFGSREKWEQIPSWDKFEISRPSVDPLRLKHGYDETKAQAELNIEDMKAAAEFRGGQCLSKTMTTGDLASKLKWCCAFGHKFEASPILVLMAGHWCHLCLSDRCNYDELAKRNPFLAQVCLSSDN